VFDTEPLAQAVRVNVTVYVIVTDEFTAMEDPAENVASGIGRLQVEQGNSVCVPVGKLGRHIPGEHEKPENE